MHYADTAMLRLTDDRLRTVMTAATPLPPEKRDIFLQRTAAQLQRIRRPTDDDLKQALHAALKGLMQMPAAI